MIPPPSTKTCDLHTPGTASGVRRILWLCGIVFISCAIFGMTVAFAATPQATQSQAIRAKIDKKLRNKKYRAVTVMVHNGIVTLSGEVDLYAYKADAEKTATKTDGVRAVQDNIAVAGPAVSDQKLQQELLEKIQIDRAGFGQVFDAIAVQVQDGVVTLGGHAIDPASLDSAVSLAEYMPGVRGVVNRIQVDPLSPMDDQIRMAEFHAIYDYGALSEYSAIPTRPIRISVQDGHVTLYGEVFNQMDKDLAGQRANQVPGVFHVTNNLMIASQNHEKK